MAFHLGSLGFLTPFEFDNFREQVTNVLEGERFFELVTYLVTYPYYLFALL